MSGMLVESLMGGKMVHTPICKREETGNQIRGQLYLQVPL